MSRTEIYRIMEYRKINLSVGSNAFDSKSLDNGVGVYQPFADKSFAVEDQNIFQDVASLAGNYFNIFIYIYKL